MTDDKYYFDPETHRLNGQFIDDSLLELAIEDPAIEAIFSNANPNDYANQILHVAIHRGYVLDKIEKALHS